ncbi:MAG: hypothetical protein LBI74_04135 [Synergistaceae bacterium]|nr:hypothetical protein [Synergistaceae bacterium]
MIETLEQDSKKYTKNSTETAHFDILIAGKRYDKPEDAGKAIFAACDSHANITPSQIGEYQGFKLALSFQPTTKEFLLHINGAGHYTVSLGDNALGNIARLKNALGKLPERLENSKQKLEGLIRQTKIAKEEVIKPFTQEEPLNEKIKRLQEIDVSLNLDTAKTSTQKTQDKDSTIEESEGAMPTTSVEPIVEEETTAQKDNEKQAALDRARLLLGENCSIVPSEPGRSYSGNIIETSENYAIQKTGYSLGIIHDLQETPNLKAKLFVGNGKDLEIIYDEQGKCQVKNEHEREHVLSRGR